MDLGTIKAKLARTHGPRYITIDDFLGDIQLVFSNCTIFNDVCILYIIILYFAYISFDSPMAKKMRTLPAGMKIYFLLKENVHW